MAVFVSNFPPKWLAGTEIAAYNIARYFTRMRYEVHVFTTLDEGMRKETVKEGFFIHRINRINILILRSILFVLETLLITMRISPDIIHAQGISPSGFHAFLMKKTLRIPYIVWCQGSEVYLPWRFKKVISNLVLRDADAVVALTNDMKREIQKMVKREVFVVPNGVNLEKFESLHGEALYKKIGRSDERTVLFVGTLRPVKGVNFLIEAVNIVKQRHAKVRLLIIGEGSERKNLERFVKMLNLEGNVIFVGRVSNERVPGYMVASDVFVLPSLSEGFPLTVLEAMASGLPIIATKVRGLPEIVKDGENGFIVEPGNPREISEKLLYLLTDNSLRERLSKNNKEKAKEYSWENVVEKLNAIYLKVNAR